MMQIQGAGASKDGTEKQGNRTPTPLRDNKEPVDEEEQVNSSNKTTHGLRDSHKEIMEKLRHDLHHSQQEMKRASPVNHLNAMSPHEQLVGSRYEADRRKLMADATLHAAALKHKFPNGFPFSAVDILPMAHKDRYTELERHRLDMLQQMSLANDFHSAKEFSQHRIYSGGESSHSSPSNDSEDIEALGADNITSPPNDSAPWTYEEQFKQLYEMGNEPDRKQFLDELFLFMQKKGSPVNRIPIMAKQTLDIYQLFKLVVSKGGLVEVINKKLWREITKGLNLPSSITSAAFTLRTQYMKYLYPYECEKYNLSSPAELQSAIDGNRREGRRPGYGYDLGPSALPLPFYGSQSLSSSPFFNPSLLSSNPMMNVLAPSLGANLMNGNGLPHPLTGRSSLPGHLSHHTAEKDTSISSTVINGAGSRSSAFTSAKLPSLDSESMDHESREVKRRKRDNSPQNTPSSTTNKDSSQPEVNVADRLWKHSAENKPASLKVSSSHIKIASQEDRDGERALVVTMDVNGSMYQGVLYAQPV